MTIIDVQQDRVPLSFNQEFLALFDKGDGEGPFGPKNFIVSAWRIAGHLDAAVLREALTDVVRRHEILRTEVVRGGDAPGQIVRPVTPPVVVELDLSDTPDGERDTRAEKLVVEIEAGECPYDELPLVRVVLGSFGPQDTILVLVAHHAAVDEWSMQLLMKDLSGAYATRTGHNLPPSPEAPQYREFTVWERERMAGPVAARNQAWWRETLAGTQIHTTRTDLLRSTGLPKSTAAHRFLIDAELTADVLRVGRSLRASPFMVMLAAYKEFLRRGTGVTDLTVPTLSSGRGQAQFQHTVGSFFNFMPLRTDVAGCGTFREVVIATRRACLGAYTHDLPFGLVLGEAPEVMAGLGDDRAIVAFQVFQMPFAMRGEVVGDVAYSDLRGRLMSQDETTDVPDGALWTFDLDPEGETVGSLYFNTNLFDAGRMALMVAGYHELLRQLVREPDEPFEAR